MLTPPCLTKAKAEDFKENDKPLYDRIFYLTRDGNFYGPFQLRTMDLNEFAKWLKAGLVYKPSFNVAFPPEFDV